jgi:YfiH family protein
MPQSGIMSVSVLQKGMVFKMKFVNNENARIDFTKEVPYISFPILSDIPFICHGFSTRIGGVSNGIYDSMNLGIDSLVNRDDPSCIIENYRRISKSIGIDPSTIVISKQVHKTNIRLVDEKDCQKGLFKARDFDETDGLITNTPGVTLVTLYADCVPLFFVDIRKKAIGLTHSGWRGTVNKIGKITVEKMQEYFDSNPKDILAVIGPSICKDCFEIGEEVAREFINAFPVDYENNIIFPDLNGKYHCDLWAANQAVLIQAGLSPENIHICGVCTSCNSDLLFSHRKTGGKRGSLAAFLALKDE